MSANITPSSGDVFRDLGVELSATERAKMDIAAEIALTVGKLGITQGEAAALMGTDQAKVSSVMRGRVKGFTLDRLIGFLLALGRDIEMSITPVGRARRAGQMTVRSRKTGDGAPALRRVASRKIVTA